MSVALPPGLYQIQVINDASKKVAPPASAGGNVTVNSSTTAVWQVSGDGVLTSYSSGPSATQARTNNIPAAAGTSVVAQSGTIPAQWLISGVTLVSNTYWKGYIMTNDGTQLFWSIDGSNNVVVNPSSAKIQFDFKPVSV